MTRIWLIAHWPLNFSRLSNIDITKWIKIIIEPKASLGLEKDETQNFQLYASNDASRNFSQGVV